MKNKIVTPAERRDDVVRTCELAVTRLENPDQGWTQGKYAEGAHAKIDDTGKWTDTYDTASACLGGALVISQHNGNVRQGHLAMIVDSGLCPAVHEVAETIRALPIEKRRFVRLNTFGGTPFDDGEVIVSFNDHKGRHQDEIIEVVNDTIKRMIDENVQEAERG